MPNKNLCNKIKKKFYTNLLNWVKVELHPRHFNSKHANGKVKLKIDEK